MPRAQAYKFAIICIWLARKVVRNNEEKLIKNKGYGLFTRWVPIWSLAETLEACGP